MVYVTRRVDFNAAHRLYSRDLSDEDNWRIFGPCSNPAGHGHNYTLEVTVRGNPDPVTGIVLNLRHLKKRMIDLVIQDVDHRHLDVDCDILRGQVSTAENLAIAFWDRLQGHLAPAELYRVRVYETNNNFADYFGGQEPLR
jgi:6-pyruvoyltetrahydropterin/6-carboxytetrahydropterin synthase